MPSCHTAELAPSFPSLPPPSITISHEKSCCQTDAIFRGYQLWRGRQQTAFLNSLWKRCWDSHLSPLCQMTSLRLFPALGRKQRTHFLYIWRDSRLVIRSITPYIYHMLCRNSCIKHLMFVTATLRHSSCKWLFK